MKKIIEFLSSRGVYLMLGGFLLALGGVIVLVLSKNNFWGTAVQNIAIAASVIGFLFYIVGRVFVAIQRQNRRRHKPPSISPKDDL